jgi:hypothetical protein
VKENGTAFVPRSYACPEYKQLGSWISTQRVQLKYGKMSLKRQRLLEDIPGWSWNELYSRWDHNYNLLLDYVKENGTALVPYSHVCSTGEKLGVWVCVQRRQHKKGELPLKQQLFLETVSGWRWVSPWDNNYMLLKKYVKENGTALVPYSHVCSTGEKLGVWVCRQRSQRNKISSERQKLLESIPEWSWDAQIDSWNRNYDLLFDYVKENGTVIVPRTYTTPGGEKLGVWVGNQLSRQKAMPQKRKNLLEVIPGWTWTPTSSSWHCNYDLLLDYVKYNGTALVPHNYICSGGEKLGAWVGTQQSMQRLGKMPSERQKLLEAIPGWTWIINK